MLLSRVSVVESCIQFFITGPPYGHNDDDARRQTFSGNFNILKTFHDALKQLKVLILIHFVRPVILLQVAKFYAKLPNFVFIQLLSSLQDNWLSYLSNETFAKSSWLQYVYVSKQSCSIHIFLPYLGAYPDI